MVGMTVRDDERQIELLPEIAYIHPTVRREIRILQLNTPPIQPSRLLEISNVLLSEDFKSLLDDAIVTYI